MRDAAAAWVDALRPELRARAVLAFDDANRRDWHYIPRRRAGVSLKEMNDAERAATHELLRAGLSSRGYRKAMMVVALEDVLREIEEGRGQNASYRDPGLYCVTVFGDAAGEGHWGWRFEGHHLSLNFSSVEGEVAVTPAFLGSNPARVPSGARAGLGVLLEEASLGRRLADSLDAEQRAVGVVGGAVPRDVLLAPGVAVDRLDVTKGLAYADMTEAQRALVEALLGEWTGNLEPGLARAHAARMREAGLEGVRFLWIGSLEPGSPHYYRLACPRFIIEYDNTQDGANHIHTVWHDPERDFGEDLLREHLRAQHGDDHDH
ncbi:MAG: DUF3500 domain-containing protein [Phycisphaerales bacterium JB041]